MDRLRSMWRATASSTRVRELGPSPLSYDYGRPERIGIIDPSAGPAKPGDTYFTSEPVEDAVSRVKRKRWDEAPEDAKPTKRKPAPVYVENSDQWRSKYPDITSGKYA